MTGRQTRTKRVLDDGLPMPYTGARQLYPTEWSEYRERQARHHERFPDYPAGWHRPTVPTAEKVWALVSAAKPDLKIDAFLPGHEWLTPGENNALTIQAMQAFVVALDAAILVGERSIMLTTNHVFDALAGHWSDNYRAVVEAGRAFVSWDMTLYTVRASWRDLLRNGVRLDAPWEIIRGGIPGLYTTERIYTKGRPAGRRVTFDKDGRLRRQLVEIIEADPVYRRHQSAHLRLLLASEDLPERGIKREIAGEWSYNVVEVGPRSAELIRRLEAARLYLHVPTFLEDMKRLEARRDELENQVVDDAVIAEYAKIHGQLLEHEECTQTAPVDHARRRRVRRDQFRVL